MLFRKSESRNDPSPVPYSSALEPPSATQQPDGNESTSPVGPRTQSFIDASLTIVGDLHAEGDVRLDGRICGNVRCAQLIVGKDAAITGSVTAQEAIVRGRIIGTIRSPVVIIQDTAHVESEITYSLLAIDDGATFEGSVRRSHNPLEEADAVPPLAELRRMMLTADAAPCESGKNDSNGRDAPGAEAGTEAPSALQPPAGNGHDPTEHRPSASHT